MRCAVKDYHTVRVLLSFDAASLEEFHSCHGEGRGLSFAGIHGAQLHFGADSEPLNLCVHKDK